MNAHSPKELSGPEQAWPLPNLPLTTPLSALAIDTTSDELSLAVLKDGALAGHCYERMGRRTTQEILPRIGALLEAAGLTPRALDLLVVARGPGAFTGTRIGMAVALTFAQVGGAPLIGVDSLRLMAAQTKPDPGREFAVLLNCARGEVYHAHYRWESGGLARRSGMALQGIRALSSELTGTTTVLRRYRPGIGTSAEDEAAFAAVLPATLLHPEPDAPLLLAVGIGRYLSDPGRVWPRVEPIYLKSEAFRTWQPPAGSPGEVTATLAEGGKP